MKRICAFIMALALLVVMTTSVFAAEPIPGVLQVGFAYIECDLTVQTYTARARLFKDSTYSNFSYLVYLHGDYYDPYAQKTVHLDRPNYGPATGIDMNLEVYMSSGNQNYGLSNVYAQYSATYLSNPSYMGTIYLYS